MTRLNTTLWLVALLVCSLAGWQATAADNASAEVDWKAVKSYQYGQDLKPLLVLERATYASLASPAQRQAMARQLLGVLSDPKATPAARQASAIQLRTVARDEEIPALVKLLDDPAVAEWARETLQRVPGPKSLEALRKVLPQLKDTMLLGTINALGARKDADAVPAIASLATSHDPAVAEASIRALGKIASPAAFEALARLRGTAAPDSRDTVPIASLQAAQNLAATAPEKVAPLFDSLGTSDNPPAVRRAALKGQLSLQKDPTVQVLQWLAGQDSDARQVAADELRLLNAPAQTRTLVEQLPQLPPAGRALVLEALAERLVADALPVAVQAASDADPCLRLAGVQSLAMLGQKSHVALLIQRLADSDARIATAARESLVRISAAGADDAILAGLKTAGDPQRGILVELLAQRRAASAIPSLVLEASQPEPDRYARAVASLRSLCTPGDLPALTRLLLDLPKGAQRDEIEKTIMLVCQQVDDPQSRAQPILAIMAQLKPADQFVLLPLVGRIGGQKAHEAIQKAIRDSDPAVHEAGIRALCNWPDASASEPLLKLAQEAPNPHRVWALRAYIRVISLPSDRPEAQTLAMLQQAMKLANDLPEKKLVLSRAAAVRSIETLRWVAPYLDDPALAQEACRTVVELAHHRFLMYPNRAEFVPALQKVIATCQNQELVNRAKEYLQRQ